MVRTEGKKQQGEVVEAREILSPICPECASMLLVRLETETGEPYTKNEEIYYDLYWIYLCPKGHGKFKVKEATYKMYLDGK